MHPTSRASRARNSLRRPKAVVALPPPSRWMWMLRLAPACLPARYCPLHSSMRCKLLLLQTRNSSVDSTVSFQKDFLTRCFEHVASLTDGAPGPAWRGSAKRGAFPFASDESQTLAVDVGKVGKQSETSRQKSGNRGARLGNHDGRSQETGRGGSANMKRR